MSDDPVAVIYSASLSGALSVVPQGIFVSQRNRRHIGSPAALTVALALASAGIARGFLAQSTSGSSGQFCMLSKHPEILPKQTEIVLKRAEKTRKTVD